MASPIDIREFKPPPFPQHLPTIDLPQISLSKLLNGDQNEAHRVFHICTETGFFYLNMLDHPKGVGLYERACRVLQVGREVMPNLTVDEKRSYKKRLRVGVLDMGCDDSPIAAATWLMLDSYNCAVANDEGQPKYLETINVSSAILSSIVLLMLTVRQLPATEMFAKSQHQFELPHWLAPYDDDFCGAIREGNNIANIIFGILEQQLQLLPGSLTSLHRLTDPSNDFLRILRYPGLKPGKRP